jgi:aspartate 1-decarboxylase
VTVRTFIAAKLHGLTVTAASVDYNGSVTIDGGLLDRAGICPYEQVHIVNLATGGRWVTYVIPGPARVFTLNGGGARLGVTGDRCVVMTYRQQPHMSPATVLFLNDANRVVEETSYPAAAAT